MATIKDLAIDERAASEGRWFPFLQDVDVKIARWQRAELLDWYREQMQALHEEFPDKIPMEKQLPVAREAVARFVIKGVRGLKNEDGTDIEYAPALGLEWFDIEGFGDVLFDFAMAKSKDLDNYRGKYVAMAEGN
jgi:hypothetical protein